MLAAGDALVAGQRAQPAGLADARSTSASAGGWSRPRRSSTGRSRAPGSRGCARAGTGATRSCSARRRRSGATAARSRGGRSRRSSSCASCSASRRAARRVARGARGCRGFKRFAVTGFAHHPYQRGGSRPPAEPPEAAGEITISSPGRLRRVLDQAGAGAPDPAPAADLLHRVRLPDQPAGPHLRRARRRSSRSTSTSRTGWPRATRGCGRCRQYKLIDEASLASFQSGLRFRDGRREAGLRRLPAADLGQRARLAAARLRPGAPGRQRDAAGRADPAAAAQRRARSRPSRRSRCARATASS